MGALVICGHWFGGQAFLADVLRGGLVADDRIRVGKVARVYANETMQAFKTGVLPASLIEKLQSAAIVVWEDAPFFVDKWAGLLLDSSPLVGAFFVSRSPYEVYLNGSSEKHRGWYLDLLAAWAKYAGYGNADPSFEGMAGAFWRAKVVAWQESKLADEIMLDCYDVEDIVQRAGGMWHRWQRQRGYELAYRFSEVMAHAAALHGQKDWVVHVGKATTESAPYGEYGPGVRYGMYLSPLEVREIDAVAGDVLHELGY